MDKKRIYSSFVLFFIFFVLPAAVYGYTKTYNMHAFDLKSFLYMNLKVSYTDNQTDETTDNETIAGILEFTVFDRSFESSEGVYVQTGEAFNGSWSATETKYSSYYETNLNTFFN